MLIAISLHLEGTSERDSLEVLVHELIDHMTALIRQF